MRIDRQLNLVKKIVTEAGVYHVHSMPISRAVWEDNFYIISQTFNAIFMGGMSGTGPKMASLMLQRAAKQANELEGYNGLMSEIRRLTNVVFQQGGAWQNMPWEAIRPNLDEEAVAEAENAIVFFICASAVLRGSAERAKLSVTLGIMQSLWDAQTTSLDVTAYQASLPISTPDAATTESQKPVSSVPC